MQSILGNKIRKTFTQKAVNKYMLKLKKYCANLIIIERKGKYKKSVQNNNKLIEPSSPRKRNKNEKNLFKSGKDKPKVEDQQLIIQLKKYQAYYHLNYYLNYHHQNPILNLIHFFPSSFSFLF